MQKIFTLRRVFIIICLISTSALFMYLGLFAINNSLKVKSNLFVSPYIVCALDYSPNGINWTRMYDNYNNKTFIDNSVIKQISASEVELTTTFTSQEDTIFLKLTNYSTTKSIQGRIVSYSINGNVTTNPNSIYSPSDPSDPNSVQMISFCEPFRHGVSVGVPIRIDVPAVLLESEVIYHFVVEEVLEVDFSNSSNLLNENYFTPITENALIKLEIADGTSLPNSVVVKVGDETLTANTHYIYHKAVNDTDTNYIKVFQKYITDTIKIDCDAIRTFKINEYAEGETKPTDKNGTEFNYYVELGEYPQEYVGNTLNATLEGYYNGGTINTTYLTAENTYTQNIFNGSTFASADIKWFTYNGEKYARSYTLANNETINFSNGTNIDIARTSSVANNLWYKVQPIRWVIIDSVDTTPDNSIGKIPLNELFYQNHQLYMDNINYAPYEDGFLLLSELALDSYYYSNTNSNYATSELETFLNTNFATNAGLNTLLSTNEEPNASLISYQALSTYGYNGSAMASYNTSCHIFPLANSTTETYSFNTYFSTEFNDTSLGVSSASDYSLAHFTFASTYALPEYERAYTTHTNATSLTSPYWLRSSVYEDGDQGYADNITLPSAITNNDINSPAIAVRPSLVLIPSNF